MVTGTCGNFQAKSPGIILIKWVIASSDEYGICRYIAREMEPRSTIRGDYTFLMMVS
jgi:hypothetical protein